MGRCVRLKGLADGCALYRFEERDRETERQSTLLKDSLDLLYKRRVVYVEWTRLVSVSLCVRARYFGQKRLCCPRKASQ